jgi:hypothetical protein
MAILKPLLRPTSAEVQAARDKVIVQYCLAVSEYRFTTVAERVEDALLVRPIRRLIKRS